MQRRFDHDRHSRIVGRLTLPSSVGECLAYADMVDVPSKFDRFAREHFSDNYSTRDMEWRDVCPAYALALMVHGTYRLPADDAELQLLWEELAPTRLHWGRAKTIVADILEQLDRTPMLLQD